MHFRESPIIYEPKILDCEENAGQKADQTENDKLRDSQGWTGGTYLQLPVPETNVIGADLASIVPNLG